MYSIAWWARGKRRELATMESLPEAIRYAKAKGIDTIAQVAQSGVSMCCVKEEI